MHDPGEELANSVLRANPLYTLRELHQLSEAERSALDQYQHQEAQYYGILAPCSSESGLRIQAVDVETARLYCALRQAKPFVRILAENPAVDENLRPALLRLVLDGVLEIEWGREFVFGASAFQLLVHNRPVPEPTDRIAKLSNEALRYAQDLDVADPALLSWRLYFYNRIPASPRLKTLLGSEEKIAGWLGLNGSPCRELLRERWKASTSNADLDGWLAWRSLGRRSPPLSGGYKLYVSPAIHRLREAIYATAEAASLFNAYSLKMGRDVYGLLRPDKIVVYFDRFEDLKQAGAMILNRLAGCEAQGVPFTAELGGEGLLSWGSDPPADWQLRPASGESWRLFVTNRLATALLTARHSRADACVEPWQFVSYRAGLDGIDTTTWAPATVDWLHTPRQ